MTPASRAALARASGMLPRSDESLREAPLEEALERAGEPARQLSGWAARGEILDGLTAGERAAGSEPPLRERLERALDAALEGGANAVGVVQAARRTLGIWRRERSLGQHARSPVVPGSSGQCTRATSGHS